MKVVELANITRKETHIYYRREFKAEAMIEFMSKIEKVPIEFVLEMRPLGDTIITASVCENINYPLMPLLSIIKSYVNNMDKEGLLP